MGDVVLFACGGGARAVMVEADESVGIPLVMINANQSSSIPMVPEGVEGCYADPYLAASIVSDNEAEVRARMRGMRIVIVFAVLGGGTGTGMLPEIARMARDEGCKVVSVVGLPMEFESRRRSEAMDALPRIQGISDRMMILDIEAIRRIYPDVKFRNILRMVARSIVFSVRCMVATMEGPFFSTFCEKMYTFAYTTDFEPSKAVTKASEATMFRTDPAFGKMIVYVSSGFGTAQLESIFSTVVVMTGIIPDIIKREDAEDTKVLVFLPVQGF